MSSTLITDYLSAGPLASRPANRPITADTALDLADPATLTALAQSITREEQGARPPAPLPPCWYPDTLFRQAATAVIAGH